MVLSSAMTTAIADLRQSLRSIARMPALAAVVVLSLGVGIGVNATIFSWAQALVLQPLPGVANASSVVLIEPRAETGSYPGTSWREYRDLRDRLPSFTDLFAARMAPFTITCRAAGSAPASGTGDDGCLPARRFGLLVSGNYFTALGLQPARGRLITPDDAAQPGAAPVVVVSLAKWHSQ